jgi:hypothetical protein
MRRDDAHVEALLLDVRFKSCSFIVVQGSALRAKLRNEATPGRALPLREVL